MVIAAPGSSPICKYFHEICILFIENRIHHGLFTAITFEAPTSGCHAEAEVSFWV